MSSVSAQTPVVFRAKNATTAPRIILFQENTSFIVLDICCLIRYLRHKIKQKIGKQREIEERFYKKEEGQSRN
jgi:hypothetical protein